MKKLKKDVVLKEFWRDNSRFASLFNGFLFDGREIIKAENLREMDSDVSGVIWDKDYEESLSRVRDVIKKMAYGIEFVILGIEAQDKIHYAMPLRVMIYDALGYLKEYQQLSNQYKNHPKQLKSSEEFLSKLKKGDKLHPIISIVIYYGEEEWDGPLSLADMVEEVTEEFREVFADYTMNLLQIRNSGRYQFANKDVQTVFEISREIQGGEFQKVKQKYVDVDISSELLRVIGVMVNSKDIIKQAENGQEVQNMCKSLELLKEDSRQLGISQGIDMGITKGIINSILLLLNCGQDIHNAIADCAVQFEMSEKEVWNVWNSK